MNSNQLKHSDESLFRLYFIVTGEFNEFVKLQLFDGYGKLILETFESIDSRLPKGIYKLNIFSNEKFEQKIILLDKDLQETWENIGSFSSLPGESLQSSTDYYLSSSHKWSKNYTATDTSARPEDSSIFIFFRYPNIDTRLKEGPDVAKTMGWRFSIVNSKRKTVFSLNKAEYVREDTFQGWFAFHAKLSPGIYYIVYKGNKQREIPLQIFEGWQTQFFLTFKKTPIFQTARINLVRQYLYNPYDRNDLYELENRQRATERDNIQLDNLLQNMQNGFYEVPKSIIRKAAYNKWENPMFAIAVCYAYLLSPDHDDDDLFILIVNNLKQKILNFSESSDLKIIDILAADHNGHEIPSTEISTPSMLYVGLKALIEKSIRFPDKVKITGLCERIITDLKGDLVWTSFVPPKAESSNKARKVSIIPSINANNYLGSLLSPIYNEEGIKFEVAGPIKLSQNVKLENTVTLLLPTDWLSQSITGMLLNSSKKEYSISELAFQFQVSPSNVLNSITKIKDSFDPIMHFNPIFTHPELSAEELDSLKSNVEFLLEHQGLKGL